MTIRIYEGGYNTFVTVEPMIFIRFRSEGLNTCLAQAIAARGWEGVCSFKSWLALKIMELVRDTFSARLGPPSGMIPPVSSRFLGIISDFARQGYELIDAKVLECEQFRTPPAPGVDTWRLWFSEMLEPAERDLIALLPAILADDVEIAAHATFESEIITRPVPNPLYGGAPPPPPSAPPPDAVQGGRWL